MRARQPREPLQEAGALVVGHALELLVDDSGECIVLPAGAEGTGHGPVPTPAARPGPAGTHNPQASERLLRNGDRIHVVGRFVPASADRIFESTDAKPR